MIRIGFRALRQQIQIRILGEWNVKQGGKSVATGANQRPILHALVLAGDEGVMRDDLERLLPNYQALDREQRQKAVRNTLSYLRTKLKLEIPEHQNPVSLRKGQAMLEVDLWNFFGLVDGEEFAEAAELIAEDREPKLLEDHSAQGHIWQKTLDRFAKDRAAALTAIETKSDRLDSMLKTRKRLLSRSLAPGVGRQVPIGEVRCKLEPLRFPWSSLRPEAEPNDLPLSTHLADLLAANPDALPKQLIAVGPPGAGKTLTAISTFLKLTDHLEDAGPRSVRLTVLYLDGQAEGSQLDFATDAWLERRLQAMGAPSDDRPMVIMAHADAFLSRERHDLDAILNWRVFHDCDILLCCGQQFYSKALQYTGYGNHVVQLEPWDQLLQKAFTEAVFDKPTYQAFVRWRDADKAGTRAKVSAVPLHLVHLLPLVNDKPEALELISTSWHLYDQVARMRLRVAGHGASAEPKLIEELGAVAHRFYAAGTPADRPIGFNLEELRQYLRQRSPKDVEGRAETIVNQTLLVDPSPGSDEFRFEEPSWDWFFVARHLTYTLSYEPDDTLKAFSRFLSADIMELCEQMVGEAMLRHHEPIVSSLTRALTDETDTSLSSGRRTIAREQAGYLLGTVADAAVRKTLAGLLSPESHTWEPDPLVRRGIVFGLANGGATEFADRYVQMLRGECLTAGPTPERDANIGFFLSFRGDQPFDSERPGKIGDDPDPARTVADLVGGLREEKHAGSWRIKLFTLIDLGRHPAVSATHFSYAIAPHLDRLKVILDRLEEDPIRRLWVELSELGEMLALDATAISR